MSDVLRLASLQDVPYHLQADLIFIGRTIIGDTAESSPLRRLYNAEWRKRGYRAAPPPRLKQSWNSIEEFRQIQDERARWCNAKKKAHRLNASYKVIYKDGAYLAIYRGKSRKIEP